MTPVELHHAVVGYPVASIRAAVEAGLRECPFQHLPNEPDFGALGTHWLTDPDSYEWSLPPRTEAQIAAIYRHLVASAN